MKPYLLFAGPNHYPHGGAGDFVGQYDTLTEAMLFVPPDDEYWAQVAFASDHGLVIVAVICWSRKDKATRWRVLPSDQHRIANWNSKPPYPD